MVILHIASIDNSLFAGVCVAVPQHIEAQKRQATIGFINVNNTQIERITDQIFYDRNFDIKQLPKPFDQPDLVVFHEAYRVEYLRISRNLRKNRIPYIIIPHGELRKEAQRKKWLKKKTANLLLFNRFIDGAAAIQCLSDKEMEATTFGRTKFVGTNGIVIPEKQKKDFRQTATRFVYVGRLETRVKGLDLLLEAVQMNADYMRKYDCKINIYGPHGDDRYTLQEDMIQSKGVQDIVTLHHGVFGEEKENALLDADVFIQTSRHEGMPMGVLEALSYGIPCLVTTGTNLGEAIQNEDAGWVAETDAKSIATAIKKTVEERDLWGRKGENAARYIQHNHSWDAVVENTLKKYRSITSEKQL